MLPYFKPGNYALFCRVKIYEVGDIVLISHDNLDKVKRINNIDNDNYFVIGDNQGMSTDSRHFGAISKKHIIGKLIWPVN